ncbi:GA-like domain-containing protein, partial [Lysinibacillus sphaericus]|uniref:GA-like domain-containing protein n=1 Tax=Lysinibacillus sphaericus TaxID=1421 RepID=UPI00403A660F
TSPTVDNINTAQDLINKIDDSNPKKHELQTILDNVTNLKAVEDAVLKSEISLHQEDVNAAREFVDPLNDSELKDIFIERLAEVQRLIDAEKAISNLEQSLLKDDYEGVKSQVDALKEHPKKDELLDRLEAIKDKIDKMIAEVKAEKAVEQVEESLKRDDYDKAIDLVSKLEDEVKRVELQERLDDVLEKIDAIEAVENSEKTLAQQDKNDAQSKVDHLPNGELKGELQNRLDEVQKIIDNLSAEEKSEKAVEKTESTLDESDFNNAKDLVNALEEGKKKDELQDRLDKVKDYIDLISEIDKTLKEAEDTLITDSLGIVQDKMVSLPDSTIKTSLQDRFDKLLEYSEAEKVVSKAEEMKVQSYKDKAQESVDQLKPWKGKDHLQERLDKLQDVIDQKEGDLIDKILNEPDNVTSQELADYTDNDVVDEKLKDYIDNIIEEAEKGNIEKGDVVQIVRLITFLERSKRSMAEEHISKYEAEWLSATVSVKSKFPNASILRAIPGYLNDALDLPNLAQELAELLNKPIEDVLSELEALLGTEKAAMLSYTVKYVTEDGEVVSELSKEAPNGNVTVKAQAPEGYELVSEGIQTFELSEDTKGTAISFIVKLANEVPQGSYSIEYVTLENEVVHTETIKGVDFGTIEVAAKAPEGYELLETEKPSKTIELSKVIPFELLSFVVKQKETSIETPPTGEGEESVEKPEAEVTTTDETNVETSDIPSIPEEITDVETVTAPTIGEETALVRSFLVASLDNAYFTATAQNTGVDHSQYLYDVSQSTVLIKAFLANPTEETRREAKNFILG